VQLIGVFARAPYFAAGPHPSRWNQFRSFGPTAARWDHHMPGVRNTPTEQSRAVLYCAPDVDTCAAEVFRSTRRIDRTRNAPGLVVFALREAVTLLDLRGVFATTIGASTAIHSGPRSRARNLVEPADQTLRGSHTAVTETSGCFANSRASQSMNTRTRSESCRRCG
jgi:RES domain